MVSKLNLFFTRIRRELDKLTVTQVIISLSTLGFFLILPVFYILVGAFYYEEKLSAYYFIDLFTNKDFVRFPPEGELLILKTRSAGETILYVGLRGPDFGIILNSLIVAITVMIFAGILGLIAAFIMARYDFPGKMFYRVTILIPLLATPFVNAYVIGKVLSEDGLFNYIFYETLHLLPFKIVISGLPAVILVQTLSYFPIVYLNVLASLINVDPSMEEQAENLGAKGFTLFRTITLPLILPGLAAGSVIVFIFSMEDLGAPIGLTGAFGVGLYDRLMSMYIFQQFRRAVGSIKLIDPRTYALAVIMLAFSILGFLTIKKYVSLRTYAMLSKGGRWNPRVRKLKVKGMLAAYLFLTLLVAIGSFPQIGVATLALTNWSSSGILPTELTLKYVSQIVANPKVFSAVRNSLTYASLAVLLIILVGASAAYIVSRMKIPGIGLIDVLATIPIAIPGVVVAVGYLLFFTTYLRRTIFDPFLNPGFLLIFSYAVRRLPFTARAIFAGLQQTHISLEEASLNLGATRIQTFFRIVLPLISANVIGGAILSFVYSMSEVSTSITLTGLKPDQGPITYYMSEVITLGAVGGDSIAAALGLLLMILQITAITLSNYILKQRVAFLGV